MIPLLDGDVLIYEVGFGCQTGWEGPDPPPFDVARELLDMKIANICALVGATSPPILFLTGKGNFRDELATILPYKGNRNTPKPFHYENLRAYMVGVLGAIMVDGMEADDAMSLFQINIEMYRTTNVSGRYHWLGREFQVQPDQTSIICSRDKDLRQVPGWHYSWECGKQPSWGPFFVEGYGEIALDDKRKLKGWGDKWFLAQCIMGDTTDNIQGLEGVKDVGAFKTLADTKTYEEGLKAVVEAYRGIYGDEWHKYLLENGQLLWMTRKLDEKGKPMLWRIEDARN